MCVSGGVDRCTSATGGLIVIINLLYGFNHNSSRGLIGWIIKGAGNYVPS